MLKYYMLLGFALGCLIGSAMPLGTAFEVDTICMYNCKLNGNSPAFCYRACGGD